MANDFKLIAIRPLEGCNSQFSKVLEKNTTYSFYQNYDFSNYSSEKRTFVGKVAPVDFYSFVDTTGCQIKVNISAIVGKNGTGKSSLVELFYMACYNLAVLNNIIQPDNEQSKLIPKINVEIIYLAGSKFRLLIFNNHEISYTEIEEKYLQESTYTFKDIRVIDSNFNLEENYFYTIALNYSLHALNSNQLGVWLKYVFHKNDSYQTPIVINPFRDKGNIDVNNEEYLAKARMLVNILGNANQNLSVNDSLKNVIDGKVASELKISLNRNKFKLDSNGDPLFENSKKLKDAILPKILKYFLYNSDYEIRNHPLNTFAIEYILSKLKSIAQKYTYYRGYEDFETDDRLASEYIRALSEDTSHITFKLRQAINFLVNDIYYEKEDVFSLSVAELSVLLQNKKTELNKNLIEILPPSFFDVDIIFNNGEAFGTLSSGEKQRVFSVATMLYHINNLISVDKFRNEHKYKRINLIFDEIELYFHPELQRGFINDLQENLKKINYGEIEGINILLITHSPFILSDLPHTNILFLGNKESTNKNSISETFAGNIHELLANNFFLDNGYIGEFSKKIVQRLIDFLNSDNLEKTVEDTLINSSTALNIINLIGEPYIKDKLREAYYTKFDTQRRIQELEKELKRLRENDTN